MWPDFLPLIEDSVDAMSAEAAHRRIADMSDAELAGKMEQVNHEVTTGGLIDATGWTSEQLWAFLLSRVRTPSVPPARKPHSYFAEQVIHTAVAPPADTLIVTDDNTDEELSSYIRGKKRE